MYINNLRETTCHVNCLAGNASSERTLGRGVVCLLHNIKKIYAGIMAKRGELYDLTGELQVAYNPA